MRSFFEPASLAVVGASPDAAKMGHVIFNNFLVNRQRGVFAGDVFAVNPKYDKIGQDRCYPSVSKIGREIETVVIVVPADFVVDVIADAAKANARAAIVISSGFGEAGKKELEDKLVRTAADAGIRVIGPNCLGIYDAYTGMDTLFIPETKTLASGREVVATPRAKPGPISLISQSGALGATALDYMAGHNMGIRSFVSLGNRCDVAEHEILDYMARDERTRIVLVYIEGLRHGREFVEAARRVTKVKPIIAFKAGRTKSGSRAAASHTASLSGSDRIYDAAFKQSGVVRAGMMEEFFDMGRALSMAGPARGNRVGILTSAGGPGIVAADRCEDSRLEVPDLSEASKKKIEELQSKGKIPNLVTATNPLDLSGSATSQMYEESMEIMIEDEFLDALIVIALHHAPAINEDLVERIVRVAKQHSKPVLAVDIGGTEMAQEFRSRFEKQGIPAFTMPDRAARAMYAVVQYGTYLYSTLPQAERYVAAQGARN